MASEVIFLALGVLGLWAGAKLVIDSAKKIAKRLNVSELLIGLTIAAIGTSLPEVATNVRAGLDVANGIDASGLAIGNIIGSNIGNIAFVLGLIGLIATLHTTKWLLKREIPMLFLAIAVFFGVSMDGVISPIEGLALVAMYVIYIYYLVSQERRMFLPYKQEVKENKLLKNVVFVCVGLGVLIFASELVVRTGILIAEALGWGTLFIGLWVGLGTSLPELTISLGAVLKKSESLSIGNIIGSNIANPFVAVGSGALVSGVGLTVTGVTLGFEFPFLAAVTAMASIFLWRHLDLNRAESLVLLIVYGLFMYLEYSLFA